MKTHFLIFFLLFSAFTSLCQSSTDSPAAYIAFKMVGALDGTIIDKQTDNKSGTLFVEIPSFYDFDMVKLKAKSTLSGYSDIKTYAEWELDTEHNLYRKTYLVSNCFFTIFYRIKDKLVILAFSNEKL